MPMTAFIGVRISWLMFARNSWRDRAAFSAMSRARATTASNARRSVTSRTAAVTRMPSSPSIEDREISAGNSDPSLRRPERSMPAPMGRTWGSLK